MQSASRQQANQVFELSPKENHFDLDYRETQFDLSYKNVVPQEYDYLSGPSPATLFQKQVPIRVE